MQQKAVAEQLGGVLATLLIYKYSYMPYGCIENKISVAEMFHEV